MTDVETKAPPETVKSITNVEVAKEVAEITMFDPGLGSYSFDNLGQAVQFANLMSRAGQLLPTHLRDKPALCLAVTLRAVHWKFDPFALAAETYMASENSMIAFQAKVFAAALQQCAGITLQYTYEGTLERLDTPVRSAKGNVISAKSYRGDLICMASAMVDGQLLTYETPPYDEILIKNSPLWHADPRQQMAYYAARGWTRRHRPGVMMGAYSVDEVEAMGRMRDVTPEPQGLARIALQARAQMTKGTPASGDDAPAETDVNGRDPRAEGLRAAEAGGDRADCPYLEDAEAAALWFEGFDSVAEAEAAE